jgi:hypothetical protein
VCESLLVKFSEQYPEILWTIIRMQLGPRLLWLHKMVCTFLHLLLSNNAMESGKSWSDTDSAVLLVPTLD